MLVQPQQAATVCELDLVQHTIGSSKRAQTLDPNQPPENSHEPLNLTLDLEYAHVSPRQGAAEIAIIGALGLCCTDGQCGTVNLGGAWRADPDRVGNRNELALCQ